MTIINIFFKGQFNGSNFNGYGVFSLNGAKYEGNFEYNYKTNIGIENWSDRSYYQGSFRNGKKDGIGFYKWTNDIIFQGEWVENKIEGYVSSLFYNLSLHT
jgi:hypothetical protein